MGSGTSGSRWPRSSRARGSASSASTSTPQAGGDQGGQSYIGDVTNEQLKAQVDAGRIQARPTSRGSRVRRDPDLRPDAAAQDPRPDISYIEDSIERIRPHLRPASS